MLLSCQGPKEREYKEKEIGREREKEREREREIRQRSKRGHVDFSFHVRHCNKNIKINITTRFLCLLTASG